MWPCGVMLRQRRLQVEIGNDPSTVFRDADWALLLGAVPRREGGSSAQLQEALYVLHGALLNTLALASKRRDALC